MKTIITFFFFFAIILYGSSQPLYTPHTITTLASGASGVTAADLDGDGDTDVLSADFYSGNITWYENNGNEEFARKIIAAGHDGALHVRVIDIDMDGDNDIFSCSFQNDKTTLHINDGNQNFTSKTTLAADGSNPGDVIDIDGDGDLDFFTVGGLNNRTHWHENDGSTNFTDHIISANLNNPRDIDGADIDGDGDMDALTADFGNDRIVWHDNDGNQNFTTKSLINGVDGPARIFIIDLDKDNGLDVLSAAIDGNEIAWHENDGNQNFTSHTINANAFEAGAVMAADMDNDGDIDVVSASRLGDEISWYENDGNQNFTTHRIENNIDNPVDVFIADVDSDGDLDILGAIGFDNAVKWYENNLISTPVAPKFNKYGGSPVLDEGSGTWDAGQVTSCSVLKIGGEYKMWFAARSGGQGTYADIGYATSTDGKIWTKYENNPVLTRGAGGAFDDTNVFWHNVIYNGDSYEMWYTGDAGSSVYSIGYATSEDGITWEKYSGNPVLTGNIGKFDQIVALPVVMRTDSLYKMWYSGATDNLVWQTGYATSTDGKSWTKYEGNPVLGNSSSGKWDINASIANTVLYNEESNSYQMWYHGRSSVGGSMQIGYATSSNGITWTKNTENPVLSYSLNCWDNNYAWFANVMQDNGVYKMWYSGLSTAGNGGIGYAATDLNEFDEGTCDNVVGISDHIKNSSYINNYPNPFSSKTTVGYELPVSGKVRLSVYDIFGKELEVLIDANRKQGAYEVEWDAKGLPSGVYFYRLSIDGQKVSAMKMILTK